MRTEYKVPAGLALDHAPFGWLTTGYAVVIGNEVAMVGMVDGAGRRHDVARDLGWTLTVGTEVDYTPVTPDKEPTLADKYIYSGM